jgi:hypothetical protein
MSLITCVRVRVVMPYYNYDSTSIFLTSVFFKYWILPDCETFSEPPRCLLLGQVLIFLTFNNICKRMVSKTLPLGFYHGSPESYETMRREANSYFLFKNT